MIKNELVDIGKNYFKKNSISLLLPLQDIPCFKLFFCEYLQELEHVTENNLEESFRRWCRQLSSGRIFPEARRYAVYGLWFRCKLKQYHIARLLGVSTRTIRRDMRVIEKQLSSRY